MNSPRDLAWKALLQEFEESLDLMADVLMSPRGSDASRIEASIRRGYCAFHNGSTLAETLEKHGLVRSWDEIATHAMSAAALANRSDSTRDAARVVGRQMTEFLIKLQRAARDDSGESFAPAAHWQR